ncbi:MAG: glycerophosphodiester phosphodiesterase [Gemmatimonadetes bacterium]|nr:glycerophosphodiester phosphodiesterase [Gemmatimonadota bacterium]
MRHTLNPLLDVSAHPIIAHRGASAEAPENTMPAFQLAVDQGAEALELDVHVTADDVPVVIHDATLDRTTSLTGPVASCALRRLRQADAGARFSSDGGRTLRWRERGVQIPLLTEVLEAFPELPLLIEIKEPRAQGAVRRVLLDHGSAGRCVVASSEGAALEAFRAPPFLCGASRRDVARVWFRAIVGMSVNPVGYRAFAVPLRYRGLPVPTRRFLAAARKLGCPVHVWTVNDGATAIGLWRRGISGILTDAPGAMRATREMLAAS